MKPPTPAHVSRANELQGQVYALIMADGDSALAASALTLAMARMLTDHMPEDRWDDALQQHVGMVRHMAGLMVEMRGRPQ